MIACVLKWREPQEGDVIFFPNEAEADLKEVAAFIDKKMGDEVGDTIAKMTIHLATGPRQLGYHPGDVANADDPWGDLALNVRYSSGEDLYAKDCPIFTKHGQERA
jgi:hypothetical protein